MRHAQQTCFTAVFTNREEKNKETNKGKTRGRHPSANRERQPRQTSVMRKLDYTARFVRVIPTLSQFSKCTTYAYGQSFYLSQCARCHDNAESDKERKTTMRVQHARANKRLSAHRSATSAGTNSPLQCDSQKHITYLDIHCNACLRGTRTYCSSACSLSYAQAHRHLPHTITAMGIWASPSRLTYAAENSRKHHRTLDSHAVSPINHHITQ